VDLIFNGHFKDNQMLLEITKNTSE
jgi:hypothetical protein